MLPNRDWAARFLGVASLLIAAGSAYFSYRSSVAAFAALRPVLIPSLDELSFDARHVKVVFIIENRGETTAVFDSVSIVFRREGTESSIATGMRNALVYPGHRFRHVFFLDRPTRSGDIDFDPVDSMRQLGKLELTLTFASREASTSPLREITVFNYLPWHDKRIIGVGE